MSEVKPDIPRSKAKKEKKKKKELCRMGNNDIEKIIIFPGFLGMRKRRS